MNKTQSSSSGYSDGGDDDVFLYPTLENTIGFGMAYWVGVEEPYIFGWFLLNFLGKLFTSVDLL